ncbi:MAG: IS91 family transposase [Candidatus Acidiferrales bacterium]
MAEMADIIRLAGPTYIEAHTGQLLPSHRRALNDIAQCRTPALGGSLYRCEDCGTLDYRYHSCRNRHCPKCQEDRAQAWLERVRTRMLPCDYYLLTFTLPHLLRAVARAHQTTVYAALLREAAASVQLLANDRTWVGGTLGILAVLHTWSRTLEYHPHAHLLVTAGGLSSDGSAWVKPAHARFLVPGFMLSHIFRAKMRAALTRAGLDQDIDPAVWKQRWTVHVQQIGTGEHALLNLSRYVYRVALTNHRIERFQQHRVTFRYLTPARVKRGVSRFQWTPSSHDFSNMYFLAASPRSAPTACSAQAVGPTSNAPDTSSSSTPYARPPLPTPTTLAKRTRPPATSSTPRTHRPSPPPA